MGCHSSNKKYVISRQFFEMDKNKQVNECQTHNNKIKLEFTIQNCSVYNKYQIMAEFLYSNIQPFYTENIKTQQNFVTFNTYYICDFFFERQQLMRISVLKNGKNIGIISPFLGMIIGSKNSTFNTNISPDKEELISISAEGLNSYNTLLRVNFLIKTTQNVNYNDINNKISYIIKGNRNKVYESELISGNGQIKPANISVELIEPQFDICFLNSRKEEIITKTETINTFTEKYNKLYLSLHVNNDDYNIFNKSHLLNQYSLIDYIKAGVQIRLSIGIDFTSSNYQINNPNSLHYISIGSLNNYEQAIKSCGMILSFYDYEQLFPVYGFGANINSNEEPNMCFNINFQQDPEIYTIDNVIKEYRNCLKKIVLSGPIQFSPIIKKTIESIKGNHNILKYHILMILTDGVIVDQKDTIDAIIEASYLPFSLIIIGIGNADFKEMIELYENTEFIISSKGFKKMRDVVHFVPFNIYKNNPDELAAKVLQEIPKQIVEYFSLNKITPINLSMARLRTQSMMSNSSIGLY